MEGLKPKSVITYCGHDVSADFAPLLTSISYKDYLDGKASEIEIELTNANNNFMADWYPTTNDKISLLLGYEDGDMIDAGTFWVDEVSLSGGNSGDVCSIRALSLQASELYAGNERKNHQDKQISEIVGDIANKFGYRVYGDLSGTYNGTQELPPLQFLNKIAHDTGRILKIEDGTLIFMDRSELLRETNLVINRSDVVSYDLKDKAKGRLSKCTVKYWDATRKKMITGSHSTGIVGGGEMVKWDEVKTSIEARKKAKDYVTDRGKESFELNLNVIGDTRLKAGVTVKLSGFGMFDNEYMIEEATHQQQIGGYTTKIKLTKIAIK